MRNINRLTALGCKMINTPGCYLDGNGLYLQVSPTGTKSRLYKYRFFGLRREMGVGAFPTIPLTEARGSASNAPALKARGQDPLAAKHHALKMAWTATLATARSDIAAGTRRVGTQKAV
jgi:hypothetical protein